MTLSEFICTAESNPNTYASYSDKSFQKESGWYTLPATIYLTWDRVKSRALISNSRFNILIYLLFQVKKWNNICLQLRAS